MSEEIYIPKDLDECFVELNKMLKPEDLEIVKNRTESNIGTMHHGLGRWLRNNWGLWAESSLAKWFNEKGIHHADDMSGIILTSFWRDINSEPIELEEQIKFYQDFWDKNNG